VGPHSEKTACRELPSQPPIQLARLAGNIAIISPFQLRRADACRNCLADLPRNDYFAFLSFSRSDFHERCPVPPGFEGPKVPSRHCAPLLFSSTLAGCEPKTGTRTVCRKRPAGGRAQSWQIVGGPVRRARVSRAVDNRRPAGDWITNRADGSLPARCSPHTEKRTMER